MVALGVILAGLAICWLLTDVHSANSFFNALMPLGCVVFAGALAVWTAFALAAKRIARHPQPPPTDAMDDWHDYNTRNDQ